MKMCYKLGWYIGEKELLNISMIGAFEGFSGRATETWEYNFVVTTCEIKGYKDKIILPEIRVQGNTLEQACRKAINEIIKLYH